MPGPATYRYAKGHQHHHNHPQAQNSQALPAGHSSPSSHHAVVPSVPFSSPSVPSIPIPHNPHHQPTEAVEVDNQVYLHGTDGAVYKGRRNAEGEEILSSPTSPHSSRPGSAAPYRPLSASSGGRPAYRPLSADPSRHRGDVDPNSGRRSASPGRALTEAWEEKSQQTPQSSASAAAPVDPLEPRSLFFSASDATLKKKKKSLKPRPPSAKK